MSLRCDRCGRKLPRGVEQVSACCGRRLCDPCLEAGCCVPMRLPLPPALPALTGDDARPALSDAETTSAERELAAGYLLHFHEGTRGARSTAGARP